MSEPPPGRESRSRAAELDEEFWGHWLLHRAHLRALSLRLMGGHSAEADDALSTAALRARQCYPAYAHRLSSPRGWLSTLLRNVCMDRYRESKAQEQRLDPALSEPTSPDPERQLAAHEQLESLRAALGELPAHLSQPAELRFFQERSYAEIALELGLTQENVRKRIQLARGWLRERGFS